MTPSDRRYSDTHEWVKIEDGIAIVGISDYPLEQVWLDWRTLALIAN